ncbi:ABC transporter permease [Pseudoalteromonas ulvae]|uniref:ABC transporter permease n=1 Tax=Pseudoalteromonas ulvae TaxID=107327 RepID=A0A244CQU7_PSEDV|nr:ABC transporter permease [Pseudoalteromonas ulvae]OUL57997.1 hypothetical protein B1199_06450 [Pseudoalteromonas ulvae]
MKWLKHFFKQDMKLAWVNLSTLPGFSITVIATLAVTLAALAVVLNINYLVLGKSLPYPNAQTLITTDQSETINGETQYGFQIMSAQFHLYNDTRFIDTMAIMSLSGDRLNDLKDKPFVDGMRVTPEYFELLDTPMHLGRYFNDDEGINDKQRVMVLSFAYWQKHFAANEQVIGQYTQLGQNRYQIIGVTAAHFESPEIFGSFAIDAFFSFAEEISLTSHWDDITGGTNGIARLKPGVTLEQANQVLGEQINTLYQGREGVAVNTAIGARFMPLKQKIIGNSTDMALLLLAGVSTLLLIAITNLTNLFLSRAAQKHRELAIQASLGAHPKHIFMNLFAESVLLCLSACGLGLLMAGWVMVWLEQDLQYLFARLQNLTLDRVTVGASVLISVLIAAVMAGICSRKINYDQLIMQLQTSGKGTGAQISQLTRNILIASQISLATLLLIGATSVLSPALERLNKPVGFNTDSVHYLRVDTGTLEPAQYLLLSSQIKEALKPLPQINDVARTAVTPLHMGWEIYLYDELNTMLGIASVGYFDSNSFALLEHEFVSGRSFTDFNGEQGGSAEIIISESLAKRVFKGEPAVGKVLQSRPDTPLTVVGVVKDIYVPDRGDTYTKERFYLPFTPERLGFKLKLNSQLSKAQLNEILKTVDPQLTVAQYNSLNELISLRLRETQLVAGLTVSLILLALSLAAAGIYGVLSYSVQMRRYELGIHLSLGAHTHTVIALVLKQSMRPVLLGLVVGCVSAVLCYLIGMRVWDMSFTGSWLSVLLTLPVLLVIAMLACYLPVRKVVARDPLQALRVE